LLQTLVFPVETVLACIDAAEEEGDADELAAAAELDADKHATAAVDDELASGPAVGGGDGD
jgi:hypothetical protein